MSNFLDVIFKKRNVNEQIKSTNNILDEVISDGKEESMQVESIQTRKEEVRQLATEKMGKVFTAYAFEQRTGVPSGEVNANLNDRGRGTFAAITIDKDTIPDDYLKREVVVYTPKEYYFDVVNTLGPAGAVVYNEGVPGFNIAKALEFADNTDLFSTDDLLLAKLQEVEEVVPQPRGVYKSKSRAAKKVLKEGFVHFSVCKCAECGHINKIGK
jgi:hypothetical protein